MDPLKSPLLLHTGLRFEECENADGRFLRCIGFGKKGPWMRTPEAALRTLMQEAALDSAALLEKILRGEPL